MQLHPTSGAVYRSTPVGTPFCAPVFPHCADGIPPGVVDTEHYQLRFAWTRSDLHAVQRLRYTVLQEEMGEAPGHAVLAGLDEDARDPWYHHLMICHRQSGAVIGTVRLQTAGMAASRRGWTGTTLFDDGALPARMLRECVELGRSCIAPAHRSRSVLQLLSKGLVRYLAWSGKRYVFSYGPVTLA